MAKECGYLKAQHQKYNYAPKVLLKLLPLDEKQVVSDRVGKMDKNRCKTQQKEDDYDANMAPTTNNVVVGGVPAVCVAKSDYWQYASQKKSFCEALVACNIPEAT